MKPVVAIKTDTEEQLRALARIAAQKILSREKENLPVDPRSPFFASEFIRECDRLLANTPPLLQDAIENAGHAAEGTNVDPYQGLVEVLQNADDRRAHDVRVLLRDGPVGKQMLIAHDGLPVEYEHVLAMMLPFVSTKREDDELRGRFGIGLKTLRRICSDIQVHGAPYHFGSDGAVSIAERLAEKPIPDFYDQDTDTLLVLDLKGDFDAASFEAWFEAWSDDGLIFLDYVRRLVLNRSEKTVVRQTEAKPWVNVHLVGDELSGLERRTVTAGRRRYLVHRGHVQVPVGLERFHKRTGATTKISVASAGVKEDAGIFVGLRTRIPTALPFAIDAQFDPIASREGLQDNVWNRWLMQQVGLVAAHAAASTLISQPRASWNFVPVIGEGMIGDRWPASALDNACDIARTRFVELARFGIVGDRLLSEIAYEDAPLSSLLDEVDITILSPNHLPLNSDLRDRSGRWRIVLDALDASNRVTPFELINGMAKGLFETKKVPWWIEAMSTLTSICAPAALLHLPIWLSASGAFVSAATKGASARQLMLGASLPPLSQRHDLFDILHPEFTSEKGLRAIDWLKQHAAFIEEVTAADELLAFAEKFADTPLKSSDEELRELRDLLDPITGKRAQHIGERLGAAVLIEAVEAETKGKKSWRRPTDVYLPKAIDKDAPFWPNAAWGLPGIHWAHPGYDERLRTGFGKSRKRPDGTRPRGARSFLALLGAETGPRLVAGVDTGERSARRRTSMSNSKATKLSQDIRSSDIERVLRAITNQKAPKKDRRERAIGLLQALSRDWGRRLHAHSTVAGEHKALIYTYYDRGIHDAWWIDQIKDTAWVPVGRDRLKKPSEVVVRTAETQAVYKSDQFVAGLTLDDLDENFVNALNITARVRVGDLLGMLEGMRDGLTDFDGGRVYFAYQHFARIVPKTPWVSAIGDVALAEFRRRFSAKNGLVLIEDHEGSADWRKPSQVRSGKQVIPHSALYVLDKEIYRALWKVLEIGQTTIEDCVDYLKRHAEQFAPSAEQGAVIQIYRHLTSLLGPHDTPPPMCRYIPLACKIGWRARRPIYLVSDTSVRDRLATELPAFHFWEPPCDTRSIEKLVDALAIQRIEPTVTPISDQRSEEEGEDMYRTFQATVDHLSNSLGKRDASLRQALRVSWGTFRSAKLHVYDGEVPVDIAVDQIGTTVRTKLRAHVQFDPLEFHISRDALEAREGAGAAVAKLFDLTSVYAFDAEWVLAWQEARRQVADALLFAIDDAAHKAKVEATVARVTSKGNSAIKIKTRRSERGSSNLPPSPPPRELKEFQPGISSIEIIDGKPGNSHKPPIRPRLAPRTRSTGYRGAERVVNTSYSNAEIEDFGWQVLVHVLERGDGVELDDFRNRHGVGADGAFDWGEFVELKAAGRSMQTSISLTPAEFKRALERGNDYILALVYNCEKGSNTKVKLIFDPARRASTRETEGIRLSSLPDTPGIVIELGHDGTLTATEDKAAPSGA